MKRYKLLKELPFAKAGEEFQLHRGGINDYITLYRNEEQTYQFKVGEDVSGMFDEWFEEIKEPEQYYSINILKATVEKVMKIHHSKWAIENLKSLGLLFENREEAEKYLEYLKAKEVIKQDTNDFKPDWKDSRQEKIYGRWDSYLEELFHGSTLENKDSTIYFKTEKDIRESFRKHPNEWKAYLTYEQ